jgi:hypothetical protein
MLNSLEKDAYYYTKIPYLSIRDFWKRPEISDYTDYGTITPIRNVLKIKKDLCNPFWNLCNQESERRFFRALSKTFLTDKGLN